MRNGKIGKEKLLSKYYKDYLTLILGFCSLRYFPAPVIVPPVPIPETRTSIFPPVLFHISGPVVS